MSIHVAILQPPYLDAVLARRKTIESRLTRTAQPPYGMIATGERVFLKRSGGAFAATATAGEVYSYDQLTPRDVEALRKRFNVAVGGDAAYWRRKRDARFATFIELCDVLPIDTGPAYRKSPYKAWFVLPDDADPVLDVPLSDGALRNGYVPVTARPGFFDSRAIDLLMPDGKRITTDLYRGQRLRWRGWRGYFQAHDTQPGDRVRFVRHSPRRYRVMLITRR